MPRVEANGLTFNTRSIGDGPRLAMLHGLLRGTLASWYLTIAPALARSRSVLLYDLRGHGRTDRPPSGYGVTDMAGDLDALLSATAPTAGAHGGDDRVDLIGHSFGALVALRYAIDQPHRVRSVAAVEPPLLDADPLYPQRWIKELIPAKGDGDQRGGGGGPSGRRRVAWRELVDSTSLVADLSADAGFEADEVASLPMPVMVLLGKDSPSMAGRHLVEDLGHVEVVVLPGGHDLHVDSPNQVTEALTEFIAGSSESGRPESDRPGPIGPDGNPPASPGSTNGTN